jgi:hypothetical protein
MKVFFNPQCSSNPAHPKIPQILMQLTFFVVMSLKEKVHNSSVELSRNFSHQRIPIHNLIRFEAFIQEELFHLSCTTLRRQLLFLSLASLTSFIPFNLSQFQKM